MTVQSRLSASCCKLHSLLPWLDCERQSLFAPDYRKRGWPRPWDDGIATGWLHGPYRKQGGSTQKHNREVREALQVVGNRRPMPTTCRQPPGGRHERLPVRQKFYYSESYWSVGSCQVVAAVAGQKIQEFRLKARPPGS